MQQPWDQALMDWRALREEQDGAYNESLMADKMKVAESAFLNH